MSLEQYRITFITLKWEEKLCHLMRQCDGVDLDYQLAVMDHAISGVVNVYGFTPAI